MIYKHKQLKVLSVLVAMFEKFDNLWEILAKFHQNGLKATRKTIRAIVIFFYISYKYQ